MINVNENKKLILIQGIYQLNTVAGGTLTLIFLFCFSYFVSSVLCLFSASWRHRSCILLIKIPSSRVLCSAAAKSNQNQHQPIYLRMYVCAYVHTHIYIHNLYSNIQIHSSSDFQCPPKILIVLPMMMMMMMMPECVIKQNDNKMK